MPAIEGAAVRFSAALNAVVPPCGRPTRTTATGSPTRGDGMAQGASCTRSSSRPSTTSPRRTGPSATSLAASRTPPPEAFLARARNDPNQAVEYHLKNDQPVAPDHPTHARLARVEPRRALGHRPQREPAPQVAQYEQGPTPQREAIMNPGRRRASSASRATRRAAGRTMQLQRLSGACQNAERFNRNKLRMMSMRFSTPCSVSPEAVKPRHNEAVNAYNRLR